jgi:hypothetical protein
LAKAGHASLVTSRFSVFDFSFQLSFPSQQLTASTSSLEFSFETRSLPALTRSYPRHFTFYVARPALHSAFRVCVAQLSTINIFVTADIRAFF